MNIDAIGVATPSWKVSNQDIIDHINCYNSQLSESLLDKLLRRVEFLLAISGSETRYIRDREKNEQAWQFVTEAMRQAMVKAKVGPGEIDMLIYCGVGRGFLEPANAYFYADTLGMRCSCLDIADGCMSWVRSAQIAWSLFQSDHRIGRIMIINGEFNYDYGYPENFRFQDMSEVDYKFPTFTIGEASTATIFSRSDKRWQFYFETYPEYSDLCTIPLPQYQEYVDSRNRQRVGISGGLNFVSFGSDLFKLAEKHLIDLIKVVLPQMPECDIFFPHAASSRLYTHRHYDVPINPEMVFTDVYPKYGNTVSATIPMGIAMALEQKLLKRGDRICLIPSSAGMVFGVCVFEY